MNKWPIGCKKPDSCERNRVCMHQGCRWQGADIVRMIEERSRRFEPANLSPEASAKFLPPGPYSYETTAPVEGHHGYGHVYLVDRDGKRLANIWGPPDQKLALAEFIIKARGD